MIVYLPVEVKVRDLDPRTYLALRLAARGYGIVLGAKSGVHRHMSASQEPYLYVSKGARLEQKAFFEGIKSHSGGIIYLDEEGAFYGDQQVFYDRNHPDLLRNVDLYCCWGATQRTALEEGSLDRLPATTEVTGHPRFDLRKPKFASVYDAPENGSAGKTRILINTSFGHGNNIADIAADRDYYETTSERKVDRRHVRRMVRYHQLLVEYFIDLAIALAKAFPETEVLLRPHPVEKLETYQSALGDYANVRVANEGSVQNAIVSSVAVIHYDCTTSIEAMMFGKPVVSYQPVADVGLSAPIPLKASPSAKTVEEVIAFVSSAMTRESDDAKPDFDRELIKQYIANIDFDATTKIVDLIESRFGPIAGSAKLPKPLAEDKPPNVFGKVRNTLTHVLQHQQEDYGQMRARTLKKMPGIDRSELQNLIGRLCHADEHLQGLAFDVEPIGEHTFALGLTEQGNANA